MNKVRLHETHLVKIPTFLAVVQPGTFMQCPEIIFEFISVQLQVF